MQYIRCKFYCDASDWRSLKSAKASIQSGERQYGVLDELSANRASSRTNNYLPSKISN